MDEFTKARYEKLAKEFVDIYESDDKEGPHRAGEFAIKELKKGEYIHIEPYVTEEFRNRGYTFSGDDLD